MKTEKEIHISFSVAPQTANVMTRVQGQCLVMTEKALYLYTKIF